MRALRTLLVAALAAIGPAAAAAPVTYYFSGTVDGAGGTGSGLVDAAFSGSITYDPLAPPAPGAGTQQRFTPLAAGGLTAAIGDDSISSAAVATGVNQMWDVAAATFGIPTTRGDWLQFWSPSVNGATGALSTLSYIMVVLVDTDDDAGLGGVGSLVPTMLELARFEHTSFMLAAGSASNGYAHGGLTCLSTTRAHCIAEPALVDAPPTLALLPLALAALVLVRRRV